MFSIPHARPKLRRAAARPGLDVAFLAILLLLLCYGLLMLYSAGYAVALYRRGDAYAYIRPQLLFAALGVAAMYAASLVDFHIWHRLAWPLLGVSPVLLAIVLSMREYNGCIGVFSPQSDAGPITVTDIETRSLREADREIVKNGIAVADREELLTLLEDFGS